MYINMKIIKNSKELAKLADKNKDISIEEDLRIEFEPTREEIRNVRCFNLFLENDKQKFDFNGEDFNGRDFKGRDFNGRDFKGKKISYYCLFISYNSIECESWEARRIKHIDPICIDGKLTIKPKEDN